MRRHKGWARATAAVSAFATGLASGAAPLTAAEAPPVPKTAAPAIAASVQPSLSAAALKAAEAATASALVQDADTTPAESSGGLLSTTRGKVALALFAGGIGWTIYSAKNDRDPVKSPIR